MTSHLSPHTVVGVTATPADGAVALAWLSSLDGYRVQWKLFAEKWTEDQQVDIRDPRTLAHTITGLTNDSKYLFRVAGLSDVFGVGEWSEFIPGTPTAPTPPPPPTYTLPTAPTALYAQATRGGHDWSWHPPADLGGSVIEDYNLRYRAVGETAWQPEVSNDKPCLRVTGLDPTKKYEAQVRAETRHGGTGPWSETVTSSRTPLPGVDTLVEEFPRNRTWSWPYRDLASAVVVLRGGDGGTGGTGGTGGDGNARSGTNTPNYSGTAGSRGGRGRAGVESSVAANGVTHRAAGGTGGSGGSGGEAGRGIGGGHAGDTGKPGNSGSNGELVVATLTGLSHGDSIVVRVGSRGGGGSGGAGGAAATQGSYGADPGAAGAGGAAGEDMGFAQILPLC